MTHSLQQSSHAIGQKLDSFMKQFHQCDSSRKRNVFQGEKVVDTKMFHEIVSWNCFTSMKAQVGLLYFEVKKLHETVS